MGEPQASEKGRCPKGCPKKCNKESFKFECIYTGVEPEFGTEGTPTPAADFGESMPYQVFSLASMPSTLSPLLLSMPRFPLKHQRSWRDLRHETVGRSSSC